MPAVGLPSSPKSIRTNFAVIYATRSSLVAADLIVLVLTWTRTFHNWNEARKLNLQLSVSTCLLRDGKSLCIMLRVGLH